MRGTELFWKTAFATDLSRKVSEMPHKRHDPLYSIVCHLREIHLLIDQILSEQGRQGDLLDELSRSGANLATRDAAQWDAWLEGSPISRELTPREREVLPIWVSCRGDDQATGDLLYISPATVKNHVQNICAKLGIDSDRHTGDRYELLLTACAAVVERYFRPVA